MHKIAIELLTSVLEECNEKLSCEDLPDDKKKLFAETSSVLMNIILDSEENSD